MSPQFTCGCSGGSVKPASRNTGSGRQICSNAKRSVPGRETRRGKRRVSVFLSVPVPGAALFRNASRTWSRFGSPRAPESPRRQARPAGEHPPGRAESGRKEGRSGRAGRKAPCHNAERKARRRAMRHMPKTWPGLRSCRPPLPARYTDSAVHDEAPRRGTDVPSAAPPASGMSDMPSSPSFTPEPWAEKDAFSRIRTLFLPSSFAR